MTLNLGLRYEYVDAPTRERGPDRLHLRGRQEQYRTADSGIAYAPLWESGFLGKLERRPGRIAFHAGYGIYDGRIFQSVFSQGGANVRFNPPNALDPHGQQPSSTCRTPRNGFVFTPGVQTARATITLPEREPRDALDEEVESVGRAR